jgi:hypothetical protein
MSPNTRKLTMDFIRRVPLWAWPAIVIIHAATAWAYLADRHHPLRLLGVIFALQAARAVHNSAWLRIVRSMPVTPREIGHTRWWANVGMPGIVFTAVNLAVLAAVSVLGRLTADTGQIVLWFIASWAVLGLWGALIPVIAWANLYSGFLAPAVVILWLVLAISSVSGFQIFHIVPWMWVPFGLAGAVALYIYAAEIVVLPANLRRSHSEDVMRQLAGRSRPSKLQGWWALARYQLVVSLSVVLTFVPILFGVTHFADRKIPSSFYAFVTPALLMGLAMTNLPSPRLLRLAPVTVGKLSAILQALVLTPCAFGAVVIPIAYAFGIMGAQNPLPLYFLGVSLQLLQLPIRLRFDFLQAQLMMTGALFTSLSLIPLSDVFQRSLTSPDLSIAELLFAVLVGAAGYIWTYYELAYGTRAYRVRAPAIIGIESFSGRSATSAG